MQRLDERFQEVNAVLERVTSATEENQQMMAEIKVVGEATAQSVETLNQDLVAQMQQQSNLLEVLTQN